MGPSYFEVQIEIPTNSEEEIRFDKSDQTYLSIGVANSTFDVERCITGWTSINDGAGYYNSKSYPRNTSFFKFRKFQNRKFLKKSPKKLNSPKNLPLNFQRIGEYHRNTSN